MISPLNRSFYAEEAEQSVVGALLRSERALREVTFLTEDDFTSPANRRIFAAIKAVAAQKKPVDIVTVDEELGRMNLLDAVGGTGYLIELTAGVPSAANIRAYADLVREASLKRQIRDIGENMAKEAADPMIEISLLLDSARAKLRNLASPGKNPWKSMDDVLLDTYAWLENLSKNPNMAKQTGISTLDWILGGLYPGELTVIASRPSVGKSALGLQIAMATARQSAHAVFTSLEMKDVQLGQRILSNGSGVAGTKLRRGDINEEDWDALAGAMQRFAGLPVSFYVESRYVEDIRMEIQRKLDMGECDLAVIDYLQLMNTRRKTSGDTERVGECSRAVKSMALEFNVPVISLAQVNRQSQNSGKARCPVLSELRSSGEIEQDADNVIFIHRPDDADDPTVDKRDKEYFNRLRAMGLQYIVLSVAKQRQGETGIVPVVFDASHMRYSVIDRTREETR